MLLQDMRQAFGNNFVFAWLEHERAHAESGLAFPLSNHNGWLGIPQQLRNLFGFDGYPRIPGNFHVWNVICDVWGEEFRAHARNLGEFA